MPIVSELILSLMLTASLSAGAPLSAPPGLAVSLPAITAQAQQLHTPLMILHAGGVTPEGVTGSNSLEALEHSYENGFRLLELDFSWTCDGELVCVHDWNAFYGRILDTDSPTLAQFEAVRDSTYGFTDPGSSDRLAEGTPRRLHRHRHQRGLRGGRSPDRPALPGSAQPLHHSDLPPGRI